MAQPNLAREPSMDEILASIRRIIESNEPVTEARLAALGDLDGFVGQAANDDMEDVPLTVDGTFDQSHMAAEPVLSIHGDVDDHQHMQAPMVHFRTEPAMISEPAASQPAAEPKTLSLADVAARVRAASERGGMMMREQMAEPVLSQPEMAPPVSYASPISVTPAEPEEEIAVAQDMAAEETASEISITTEVELEQDANLTTSQSLLSSLNGDKVARSFQDLAVALDAAQHRSLDEIAEEMLRPMLQEWLDDNLPTMVERLVREEIERVARGPRR
jgi:cell pole-organizing protein PopZ